MWEKKAKHRMQQQQVVPVHGGEAAPLLKIIPGSIQTQRTHQENIQNKSHKESEAVMKPAKVQSFAVLLLLGLIRQGNYFVDVGFTPLMQSNAW